MNLQPLPVRRMTNDDLRAVLFINFPTDWPWEKSREELERMIRRNGDKDISPSSILTALVMEQYRLLNNLPDEELQKGLDEFWKERAERLRAMGIIRTNDKPKGDDDWSF